LFDPCAATINPIQANPAVNSTAIIADLESITLFRFDEVQVLRPANLAQHDNCTVSPCFSFSI
jgi:hypothetical protein